MYKKLLIACVLFGAFALSASAQQTQSFPPAPIAYDLYFGMRNNGGVHTLQEFLTKAGFYAGPITGNYFSLTREAVRKFQRANKINPTGYFGPLSRGIANKMRMGLKKPEGSLFGILVLEPSKMILRAGERARVQAFFIPPCPEGRACAAVLQSVNASLVSDNPGVALVGDDGITAVARGQAVITATYAYGGNTFAAEANVTVVESARSSGALLIDPSSVAVKVGERVRIKALFAPPPPACRDSIPPCMIAERAPYEVDASFVSANPAIAAIETVFSQCAPPPSGIPSACGSMVSVLGVSAGETTVAATYAEGGRTYTAKANVAVR